MGGVIAKIAQLLTGLLNNQAARMLMYKMFIKALIVAIVPVVVFMGFNTIFRSFVDFQVAQMNAMDVGLGGTVVSLAGLAAYLYNALGLNVGLSMMVSAFGIVLLGRSIPFLR